MSEGSWEGGGSTEEVPIQPGGTEKNQGSLPGGGDAGTVS